MNPHLPSIASSELLILIRGGKRTGKTSLLKRMSGRPVSENYEASTITQTTTIRWKPESKPSTTVSITLLDVVSMNPRLTTTAHGTPHGIIVIYDPRDSESVTYAAHVIENTPTNIPVALLTNFQDLITADLHPTLRPFTNRCHSIASSMVTNLGLAELSHWLELPLALNIYNSYSKLFKHTTKEISRLKSMFAPGNANRVINLNAPKDEDDGFWSDDDNRNSFQKFSKAPNLQNITLYANNNNVNNNGLPEIRSVPELTDNTGPIDKDDELMQAIIQTASRSKTIIGKDEIDYDRPTRKPIHGIPSNAPPIASVNLQGITSSASTSLSASASNILNGGMNNYSYGQPTERKKHHHGGKSGERRRHHHRSANRSESQGSSGGAPPQIPLQPMQVQPRRLPQNAVVGPPPSSIRGDGKVPTVQQFQIQNQMMGRRDIPQQQQQIQQQSQKPVQQPQAFNDYDTI
ncbi:hypothetical protein TRFO_12693 [Tritrichomonas foetus]|uniref:Uncharacterized protein n=1 Tax=Tritrichomonas foetus TaxID=1144522 RepID=A0A1J4L4Z8_9EUKA|nr:hypothetical protein TRFO_12693 [Tritrichomonas foetus]|eukprot:OHT17006.1 hypothetical protein TRFO_12693 [Tritrichomonas foetus]